MKNYMKSKTLSVDRAVIEINGGCNYSCSMCPQDARTVVEINAS